MSKVSSKNRYLQLKEWLDSRSSKKSHSTRSQQTFSKADYYKSKQ